MNSLIVCQWLLVTFLVGSAMGQSMDYPYHFTVHRTDVHVCDGALISPNHILVPATCVYEHKDTPSLYNVDFSYMEGYRWEVASITVNPSYLTTSYDYDIAILTLAQTMPSYGIPIALATSEPTAGQIGEFTGYGWYTTDGEKSQYPLLENDLIVISNDECSSIMDQAPSKLNGLTERMMCAKNTPDEKRCVADPGSPLVIDGVLVGLMSWSAPQCQNGGPPGVFSDISQYSTWINSQIGSVMVNGGAAAAAVATGTVGLATGTITTGVVNTNVVAQQNQATIYG